MSHGHVCDDESPFEFDEGDQREGESSSRSLGQGGLGGRLVGGRQRRPCVSVPVGQPG